MAPNSRRKQHFHRRARRRQEAVTAFRPRYHRGNTRSCFGLSGRPLVTFAQPGLSDAEDGRTDDRSLRADVDAVRAKPQRLTVQVVEVLAGANSKRRATVSSLQVPRVPRSIMPPACVHENACSARSPAVADCPTTRPLSSSSVLKWLGPRCGRDSAQRRRGPTSNPSSNVRRPPAASGVTSANK
jgi:hypothetical protein